MERSIVGFHCDPDGDWVAHLACGHRQHVRHRPPFQVRPWVIDEEGRAGRLGAPLDCPLCDRAEWPEGLEFVRTGPEWNSGTLPEGIRREHRLAPGTWGRLRVSSGRLRFVPDGPGWAAPPVDLGAGSVQAIPPGMTHHVEPAGPVAARMDFFRVPAPSAPPPDREGGESACYAHLVCAECGALVDRPGAHRPGCPAAGSAG